MFLITYYHIKFNHKITEEENKRDKSGFAVTNYLSLFSRKELAECFIVEPTIMKMVSCWIFDAYAHTILIGCFCFNVTITTIYCWPDDFRISLFNTFKLCKSHARSLKKQFGAKKRKFYLLFFCLVVVIEKSYFSGFGFCFCVCRIVCYIKSCLTEPKTVEQFFWNKTNKFSWIYVDGFFLSDSWNFDNFFFQKVLLFIKCTSKFEIIFC